MCTCLSNYFSPSRGLLRRGTYMIQSRLKSADIIRLKGSAAQIRRANRLLLQYIPLLLPHAKVIQFTFEEKRYNMPTSLVQGFGQDCAAWVCLTIRHVLCKLSRIGYSSFGLAGKRGESFFFKRRYYCTCVYKNSEVLLTRSCCDCVNYIIHDRVDCCVYRYRLTRGGRTVLKLLCIRYTLEWVPVFGQRNKEIENCCLKLLNVGWGDNVLSVG